MTVCVVIYIVIQMNAQDLAHSFDYCEIILFRGVLNYMKFVGKTIHEFKYPQNKILSVRYSNLLVI